MTHALEMRIALWLSLSGLLLAAPAAGAHDLHYEVIDAPATTVRFQFGDGQPFSFEAYEVYAPGQDVPHQVGRTDSMGRLSFIPHQAGAWRIRVASEDGHGMSITLETDSVDPVVPAPSAGSDRTVRIVAGVGIVLGVFGIVSLFFRRRVR
ncbi:MAG: ABC transporter permease [Candidatus Eisenbacteria bacterium]|nr:ABC transporter permease [Candidatus Eisenbacteria bacterium]